MEDGDAKGSLAGGNARGGRGPGWRATGGGAGVSGGRECQRAAVAHRTYSWTIDKECCPSELTLPSDGTGVVQYTVTCANTHTDGSFAVQRGRDHHEQRRIGDHDQWGGGGDRAGHRGDGELRGDVPLSTGGGGQLVCSYSATLPDTTTRNVNVTVMENGTSCFYQTAADFASATIAEIDECINVVDSWQGFLGTCCAGQAPTPFTYCREIGPICVCGDWPVTNTVHFTTNDTLTTGCDSCTMCVHVPCRCTRTPGYWKTHSEFGPAPYDATWAQLPSGASTTFFLSGKTYYQVLWTPRQGTALHSGFPVHCGAVERTGGRVGSFRGKHGARGGDDAIPDLHAGADRRALGEQRAAAALPGVGRHPGGL